MKIKQIKAREILDSRGNPTVEAQVFLKNNISAIASVPSGASTGKHEALELRDNEQRYMGKGVLKAVDNINKIIAPKLAGLNVKKQKKVDSAMIKLDGTENKSSLGANAMLAVSLACCRVSAKAQKLPLYKYVSLLFGKKKESFKLPIPMVNILNGGKHASGSTDLQEYMIMPIGARNIRQAVHWSAQTFHTLKKILKEKGMRTTVGDEGGFAPKLESNQQPLKLIVEAIEKAGYKPGKQISIALDPAANEVYKNGKYHLKKDGKTLSSRQMVDMYADWVKKYPIISIEDGLAEDDWDGFQLMTKKLGKQIQVVGDDLYVTNPKRLKRGIKNKTTNAILIKVNQIGTLTETLNTVKMAYKASFNSVVSHRSGETEDAFIADLAVGLGTGQIKTGSMCRSERTAKYNRLIRIEEELGNKAKLAKLEL